MLPGDVEFWYDLRVNAPYYEFVDYAVVPGGRSSPSYTRNAMVGALLGAVMCIAVLVLLYMLDDKIHSEEYLTQN